MADSKEFVRLVEANAALVASLVQALQGMRPAPTPTPLQRFLGHPESPGDPTVDEWLADFDVFVRQCGVPEGERAVVLVDYLGGCAKEEVLCHPVEVRRDVGALVSLLRRVFGPWETVTSLQAEFYARMQSVGETLAEYSRALIRLHQRIEGAAPTVTERQALVVLGDGALKHQFVVGVRKEWVRRELRRLMWRLADKPFIVVRGEALRLLCEEEDRLVQMRPVEKATPALSVPVGGSVADVLGLDAVVLGDGGVSAGAVGRYVSVGDVSVSGVGDPVGCCVDKVLSGAVSGGLCDIARVSGGGDTEGCCVDKVLSGAVSGGLCDIDRVSGGGDTDVCGVDKVLSGAVSGGLCDLDGVSGGGDTDVCGVDKVLSGAVSGGLCDLDRVSGGGDTDGCCVDMVLSGAVSGGLCDLDRVSGGGDTEVSYVDAALSSAVSGGLCDLDRVSRGVTVVGDGDVSVAGGGDLAVCVVVSGVAESVCGVNSVMTAGVLDLCGVDTVMSGVDRFVCSVSTATTAGESEVCGGDSVVSGEAGESSRVDVFVSCDDVVCGDDPLLVGVGDCLLVVGDAMLCRAGVTRDGGGDAESSVVVGSGVAPPGGVDGLVCADDSLRPEPPPIHAMCLRYCILLAAAC